MNTSRCMIQPSRCLSHVVDAAGRIPKAKSQESDDERPSVIDELCHIRMVRFLAPRGLAAEAKLKADGTDSGDGRQKLHGECWSSSQRGWRRGPRALGSIRSELYEVCVPICICRLWAGEGWAERVREEQ